MARSNDRTANRVVLPPWGYMDELQLFEAAKFVVPKDWRPPDGGLPTPEAWSRWLETVIVAIDSLIWPKYVAGSTTWSSAHVRDLNDADFLLMSRLHAILKDPIDTGFPTSVSHQEVYEEEDVGKFIGFERYDPLIPFAIRDAMPEKILDGMRLKAGTTTLQLKKVFQRPRAYQVAFLQGRTTFACAHADSADTPSLVSGHCYQGIMGMCHVFLTYAGQVNANTKNMFGQLAVDIGDRRVFAGVHYPSDSMSSWLTALMAIPLVFAVQDISSVRRFLWNAISTKSSVFAAIVKHTTDVGSSPYARCLRKLKELGTE